MPNLASIILASAAGLLVGWLLAGAERARLQTALEHERKTAGQLDAKLRDSFASLAAQSLEANNAQFIALAESKFGELRTAASGDLDLRHQRIDELVKPVRDGIDRVRTALVDFDKQRATGAATLEEQIRALAGSHAQLAGNTQDLVTALRAPQGRGQWGEMQLRRVVELAGMQSYCDFQEQASVSTDSGRLRPDLTVRLPGGKVVIVDSKAPMSAYLDAVHESDDAKRDLLLAKHAQQVRKHIDDLAGKDYASEFPEAPDFVVMFLPGEDFFSAACRRDASLIDYAVENGVMPSSPITLITLLKAVAYGWEQAKVSEKTEEIRSLGQEMYDRMGVLVEHLNAVKKGLQSAVESFNRAVGSLESRVIPTSRKFADLGAGAGGEIPVIEKVDAVPRLLPAPEMEAR